MNKSLSIKLGAVSCILYMCVSGWLLCYKPEFESGITYFQITYITLFIFLFIQGVVVLSQKGKSEGEGMSDILFSFAVFVFLILVFVLTDRSFLIWLDIFMMFFLGSLYDLLVNNRFVLRMFRLSTHVNYN